MKRKVPRIHLTQLKLGILFMVVVLLYACSDNGADKQPGDAPQTTNSSEPLTTAVEAQPTSIEKQPEEIPGILVQLSLNDITETGFESVPFYHDIPGLLREMDDPILSTLGKSAGNPEQSRGDGFANTTTGELVFAISVALPSAQQAQKTVDYISSLPPETILLFISPDEDLFTGIKEPQPKIGNSSVHYFLQYGIQKNEEWVRNVATDLIVFAEAGTIVFVLHSVNTTDESTNTELRLDINDLSENIYNRYKQAKESAKE